jgi:2,4-dienoyl-CoA reductase-like NADH-dependent reductase (Old Yellow Enzyme family)
MADLFSPIRIGSMDVANRLMRSATHDFNAGPDGGITEGHLALYGALARGGTGLIVSGHAYVRRDGKCSTGMIAIDDDDRIPGLAQLARTVHEAGPARVVVQVNFGGAQVRPELRTGELLAPSPREDVPEARPFTAEEAEALVECYVQAARRAAEAGFDGVQIHGAHGYFLNQVLSPLTNRRTDGWGGPLDGRARMLLAIVAGIRKRLGKSFPLLLKIASHDAMPGGLEIEDAVEAARRAQALGLDCIEVSGGMRPGMNMRKPVAPENEGFFLEQAKAFKAALTIPVASVNGWRSFGRMKEAVESGLVDMISLCRPLIREPDLPARLRDGRQPSASCISCNECLKHQQPLRCWALEGQASGA